MRLVLVGADFEENLGVGMLAAAARAAGHAVEIVPFNDPARAPAIASTVAASAPDVVGLSIQFQHRAHEFLALSRRLRAAGYAGHVTCGGHFPTLAWREVLSGGHGIDTVALHEGEASLVDLLDALGAGRRPAEIPGLALLSDDGAPIRTAPRPLLADLDPLPFPERYRAHGRHVGIPFIPILGSRGCWGSCSYCSITSFYRDARAHGGGRTLRLRSPENIAAEMALLWHRAGGPSIFCFHDDNFLLPRPADTLARMRAIRAALDGFGVGKVGIVGKCRPDCLTPELARELRDLGVLRLYVGVENASQEGAEHLHRRTQAVRVAGALAACREAGIFVCYNLLVFEPDATLDHLRENVAFIRAHAAHPVNFCRAEPYYGTPLHLDLAARQSLGGSYLGWNYRIEDDRAELAFRVASAAFRQRNFDPDGVGNRYMGIGYTLKLIEHFHGDRDGLVAPLAARCAEVTRGIALETADLLDEVLRLAEAFAPGDGDWIERETALLGLRIAAADRGWHADLDELYGDMNRFVERAARPRGRLRPPRALAQWAQRMALGASLAASAGLSGCGQTTVVDPVPPPIDGSSRDILVVDPAPRDLSSEMMVVDPPPPDMGVSLDLDPVPRDMSATEMMVVDPLPPDMAVPPDGSADGPKDLGGGQSRLLVPGREGRPGRPLPLIDQWRDSSPELAVRTRDLPLHGPPVVALSARREGEHVHVTLVGGPAAMSARWEAEGAFREAEGSAEIPRQAGQSRLPQAAGSAVVWTPASANDQLRVAVRSRGGVAIVSLRRRDLDRTPPREG